VVTLRFRQRLCLRHIAGDATSYSLRRRANIFCAPATYRDLLPAFLPCVRVAVVTADG